MKQSKNAARHYAVCIDSSGYPASLELYKIYRVLPDKDAAKDGDVRVIDESGEDYLYPASRFMLVKLPDALKKTMSMRAISSTTAFRSSSHIKNRSSRSGSAIRKSADHAAK